jgi:hypothetical protein
MRMNWRRVRGIAGVSLIIAALVITIRPPMAGDGGPGAGSTMADTVRPTISILGNAAIPGPADSNSVLIPAPGHAASPSTTAPTPQTTVPPTPSVPATPAAMGAAALTLVRFPWQRLPGYQINFLPISDAPEPGFYGETTFTWGRSGGVSTLYVFPGETVEQLAGITAFEIGHEVDAALVEPEGGHAQIEQLLQMVPQSWAPTCNCSEQHYLSGWYAAAFSNYWSPGVGQWSVLAPEPSGLLLAAMEPWLDPGDFGQWAQMLPELVASHAGTVRLQLHRATRVAAREAPSGQAPDVLP